MAFAYTGDARCSEMLASTSSLAKCVGIVGPDRQRQVHHRQPDPAVLRSSGGHRDDRRRDVRDYKLHAVRDQIGYVLQETVLFRGTVLREHRLLASGRHRERSVDAARLANADEFISRMPNGYDTMVGERGQTLSGGQRQRIGIARAMMRNSPILILDEPTAALDTRIGKAGD